LAKEFFNSQPELWLPKLNWGSWGYRGRRFLDWPILFEEKEVGKRIGLLLEPFNYPKLKTLPSSFALSYKGGTFYLLNSLWGLVRLRGLNLGSGLQF